ncbi:PadR family transcriptional regulator [Dactylosporangium sp. CA-092794]|uniref:PadR family transcriptional regulator n=1 Tax=Dactylosporangium sp. CA-092794 TaxID=3239929 RepID=UPI003D8E5B94
MTRSRRPSRQTAAVLRALATAPEAWRHGYDLGREVGLKAGSLYPILIRLADTGLLDAEWEPGPPRGRPPRHLYRLTPAGLELARSLPAPAPTPAPRPHPAPAPHSAPARPKEAW